jgi:hypothetical protein
MASKAEVNGTASILRNGTGHGAGLDAHRLRQLHEHAQHLKRLALLAKPYASWRVSAAEMQAWSAAYDDLLADRDRLAALLGT